MSAEDEGAVAGIVVAIRRYFATHPDAADSIEGIQRWWLLPQSREEPRLLIERALDRLVAEGAAHRTVLEDGRVIYANPRRRA